MWFVTQRKLLLTLAIGVVGSCVLLIAVLGLPFGIDFTGGSLTEVVYEERPEQGSVAVLLDQQGLGAYSLRETGVVQGEEGFIIRTRDLSEAERTAVSAAVVSIGVGGEVTRFTSVGPVIGAELKDKATWAIALVSLIIVLYVAYAFAGVSYPVGSWTYGGITIVALIHDVIIPTAAMALLGYFTGVEIDVLFVMALLAVLGYSVNDTIVVFDRVRENLMQYRTEKKTQVINVDGLEREESSYTLTKPFAEIVGMSIDQTLVRSLNTSATTLVALIALYIFGGSTTEIFALILMIGVIAGTYSSICVANPLLVYIAERNVLKSTPEKIS